MRKQLISTNIKLMVLKMTKRYILLWSEVDQILFWRFSEPSTNLGQAVVGYLFQKLTIFYEIVHTKF